MKKMIAAALTVLMLGGLGGWAIAGTQQGGNVVTACINPKTRAMQWDRCIQPGKRSSGPVVCPSFPFGA